MDGFSLQVVANAPDVEKQYYKSMEDRKMKKIKHQSLTVIVLCFIFASQSMYYGHAVPLEGNRTSVVSGTLTLENQEMWQDSAWIFFTTELNVSDSIIYQLSYEGDLDLDMRLYVTEDPDAEQEVLAWDISHCELDQERWPHIRTSMVRTTNTSEAINGTIGYTNEVISNEPRVLYLLIFVFSGEGSSEFTLSTETGQELEYFPHDQAVTCQIVLLYWIAFIGITILLTVGTIKIIRVKTMTEEEKQERLEKKEAKLRAKKKAGKKQKKGAMKKRRGKKRRR